MVRIPLADAADGLNAREERLDDLRIEERAGTGPQFLKDLRLVPSLFVRPA